MDANCGTGFLSASVNSKDVGRGRNRIRCALGRKSFGGVVVVDFGGVIREEHERESFGLLLRRGEYLYICICRDFDVVYFMSGFEN